VLARPWRSTWVLWLALALAAGVRLALLVMRWPVVNSDEATMGLMAWHIAEGRQLPVFFYGQRYMGSLVAYGAAPLFWLVGPSTAALRLVTTGLFLGFMVVLWKLAAVLYDRRVASVSVLMLAFGSIPMVSGQLLADGHNATRLLTALVLLLAVGLARRPQADVTDRARRRWLWAGWGFVAGLGLWTDLLVVPFVAASAILLLVCARSGPRWRVGWAIGGLLLGIGPMLAHNVLVPGDSTVDQVLSMVSGRPEPGPAPSLVERVGGAVTLSLPMATGASAVCAVGPGSGRPRSLVAVSEQACRQVYAGWGVTLLALLAFASWQAGLAVHRIRRGGPPEAPERATVVARLALIGGSVGTLAIYAGSSPAALTPFSSARYLQAMWVGVPAVVAGLVRGGPPSAGVRTTRSLVAAGMAGTLLFGTVQLLSHARSPHPGLIQREALVEGLLRQGMTRVYTDYWTCNAVAFVSRERIVCAVLADDLTTGFDRVGSYRALVRAAPDAPYVFREGSPPADVLARDPATRRVAAVAGYVVYRRTEAPHST
jgi:hypothetical protein